VIEKSGKVEFLVKNGVDTVVVKSKFHGRGPEYVFRDAGVEVKITEKSSIKEILQELEIKN